ncbi:hypothetical protein M569_08302 [Genlisea aurea]|uniref:WW domain-containing protein n=1 Tax=Genlisea aurea TaxID=192259 RepID=S8CID3_9LAMI|nr:hypothetical protein M569_08302 [Genlisea aurea]
MDAPNMASIQGSLQNCSLTLHQSSSEPSSLVGGDSPEISSVDVADPALELNSEVAVPFYWEQCLDLKTGEVYFVNWITGAKAKDYPRFVEPSSSEDDSSWYDGSDGSSFSDSSSTDEPGEEEEEAAAADFDDVLVVVGCKACLMYYMVPRKVDICPKCCCAHLLHFD